MVVSASYAHLHAAVRPLADEDAASRIWHIRMDRWIGYARADAALEALEELLDFPQRTRMPNLLVVGPTNNGKTMIVEKFRRAYPRIDAADNKSRVASVPVLAVQMPSAPDESRFCAAILDELGMPYDNRARLVALQDAALRTMRIRWSVKVLCISATWYFGMWQLAQSLLATRHVFREALLLASCAPLLWHCRQTWS